MGISNIIRKHLTEAEKTKCQTPETIYNIKISDDNIKIKVDLPMDLDIDKSEAILLEKNIHNMLEIVLSKYFYKKD